MCWCMLVWDVLRCVECCGMCSVVVCVCVRWCVMFCGEHRCMFVCYTLWCVVKSVGIVCCLIVL